MVWRDLSPRPGDTELDGLEAEQRLWLGAGFSVVVMHAAIAALRLSSCRVYDPQWPTFVKHCGEKEFDSFSVHGLMHKLICQSELNAETLYQGYLTAISAGHYEVEFALQSHGLNEPHVVQRWMRGWMILLTPLKRDSHADLCGGVSSS